MIKYSLCLKKYLKEAEVQAYYDKGQKKNLQAFYTGLTENNNEMIHFLVENGHDINAPNNAGKTPSLNLGASILYL